MKLIIYLILINLLTFVLFGLDKQRAVKKEWRIPEWVLFTVAILGGGPGAYIGMQYFRHKTKKFDFKYGIPTIAIIQILAGVACFLMSIIGVSI